MILLAAVVEAPEPEMVDPAVLAEAQVDVLQLAQVALLQPAKEVPAVVQQLIPRTVVAVEVPEVPVVIRPRRSLVQQVQVHRL